MTNQGNLIGKISMKEAEELLFLVSKLFLKPGQRTHVLESEYDYIEGDYIYTDGVYDDYYDYDGDYYIDGPNRGDQSLVSPEGNFDSNQLLVCKSSLTFDLI